MKTKPFDLETALAGHPVVTRDGREVTQIHLFTTNTSYPLFCVIGGAVHSFTKEGRYSEGNNKKDLFMKVETKKVWYNLYRDSDTTLYSSMSYDNKKDALEGKSSGGFYVTTIEIEEEV